MKRSKFSLNHFKLFSCKFGALIPVTWFEALPGDTIEQATSALVRCAPMVTPVMHPVSVRFHHWFVPNRLIWANWQNFITGGMDGNDATVHPYFTFNAAASVGSIGDYIGVPTNATNWGGQTGIKVNALPFRAYNLIWNEFYRDEDLQTAVALSTGDGSDVTTAYALQNISWEKDYLTSARPWVLKGPSVTLPLGTTANVKTNSTDLVTGAQQPLRFLGHTAGANPSSSLNLATSGNNIGTTGTAGAVTGDTLYPSNLYADLSGASAIDINTVRHAFAVQRFEEARARYGSRYTEYLRYLGIRSSDARLQRPEYLGGGRQTLQFSEVVQTGGTSAGAQTGVGNLAGHGIGAMRTNRYRRFFEEHGIVMTLMSVRPKTMYTQHLERKMLRGIAYGGLAGSKEDYWQRELQHIGQQGVNAWEADISAGTGTQVFGYQDRYDEYRRIESSVAGQFRSSLDTWHLGREFGSAPSLNSTFVSCVPSTRVFADTSNDNLYVMANQHVRARRLVAREGSSMTF